MMQPYTAVDLVRVMGQEMGVRHQEAARERPWETTEVAEPTETRLQATREGGRRWSPIATLLSMLGRSGA